MEQSLVKDPSKHPQESIANEWASVIQKKKVSRLNAVGLLGLYSVLHRIGTLVYLNAADVYWVGSTYSALTEQCVTANKRAEAIGGANGYSRADRLSFVTSFTGSNDTHCFCPSSYTNLTPGTLYYSHSWIFFPQSSDLASPSTVFYSFLSYLTSYKTDGWIRFIRIKSLKTLC